MGQTSRLTKTRNTKWHGTPEAGSVVLHQTEVIKWDKDTVTINTGGWDTATTRTRISQASSMFGLHVGLGRHRGVTYVHSTVNGYDEGQRIKTPLLDRVAVVNRKTGEITQ